MAEEIRGVTWDLEGPLLKGWQAAQQLYLAGFTDVRILTEAIATMFGESGWYLRAWHHNVERTDDGKIAYRAGEGIRIISTDLGFIQKNLVHVEEDGPIVLTKPECRDFAHQLFQDHPELARADRSSEIAHALWVKRGFSPWYANAHWQKHKSAAVDAIETFLNRIAW